MKHFVILLSLFIYISTFSKSYSETYKQQIEENIYQIDPLSGFKYSELVQLSKQAHPDKDLQKKLDAHLSMVYVVNRNFNQKANKGFIRVAQWNVDKGINSAQIQEILVNPSSFEKKYIKNIRRRNQKSFKEELNTLAAADIISLNEVDIGMPRTDYKNILTTLADPQKLNYAYTTEFIELGPIYLMSNIHSSLYRGLHGNAILSKYPIVSSRVIRLPNKYDWYSEETKKHEAPLESARKFGSKLIFRQHIESHEVRHGSRNVLIADIKLPDNSIITVISTHLEDRAYSDERFKQFKFLLENIKDIKNPIVLTGDFNTSTTDTKPTSAKKEVVKRLRDPHFILRATGSFFVPGLPIASGLAAIVVSKLFQYKDPFFPSIPIVFPNHERKFFNYLKRFHFTDGYGFDLSGDKNKSSNGRRGLLANSNQRHWKGFKSTFKLEEPRLIAYFKLDWFFVKPLGKRYFPFNGRTLKTLNRALKGGISDHNPITVDIKL